MRKSFFFMLVGLPGSGKSSYVKVKHDDAYVVSLDNMIEAERLRTRVPPETYGEAFRRLIQSGEMKFLEKRMFTNLDNYILNVENSNTEIEFGKDTIIWDQTNLSVKSRISKMNRFDPKWWYRIAIVFEVPEAELRHRLQYREQKTGKHIPEHVIFDMMKSYQRPTLSEGFDEIQIVDGAL